VEAERWKKQQFEVVDGSGRGVLDVNKLCRGLGRVKVKVPVSLWADG
jgi:hypothetical protein